MKRTAGSELNPSRLFSVALLLVLSISALVVAASAGMIIQQSVLGQTWAETQHGVESHITAVFGTDIFLQSNHSHQPALAVGGYESAPPTAKQIDMVKLGRLVSGHLVVYNIVRVRFFTPDGRIVFSYEVEEIGQPIQRYVPTEVIERALRGETAFGSGSVPIVAAFDPNGNPDLATLTIPTLRDGKVVGGAWVERDVSSLIRAIRLGQLLLGMLSLVGAGILYLSLKRVYDTSTLTIRHQSDQLGQAYTELQQTYGATLQALAAALDSRDTETGGHSQRVTRLALRLGQQLELSEEQLTELKHSALLHDIGKIAVPDRILHKPAPLDEQEWSVMRSHPAIGAAMISDIPFLANVVPLVRHHHERWDGAGYPDRLRGEEIPLGARIFAVADAFDAMTSHRPYRLPLPLSQVRAELQRCAGAQFDPATIAAFQAIPDDELISMIEIFVPEQSLDELAQATDARLPIAFPASRTAINWRRVKRSARTS